MALRVLLADESPTIKKVMQISLQDFAVELKTVQLGIDVQQVAELYQPEIIFCDVLLQKKSGYEVAQEIKGNSKTKHIPFVLMWSGFMELDESKFKECGADGQIEKPFDANTLRDTVKRLVKSTEDQDMSNFLDFPEVTSIGHSPLAQVSEVQMVPPMAPPPMKAPPTMAPPPMHQTAPTNPPPAAWNMDSFEEIAHELPDDTEVTSFADLEVDEFSQKPLQAIPSIIPSPVFEAPKIRPPRQQNNRGPQGFNMNDTGVIELPIDPTEEDVSHSELLSNVSMSPADLDKFNIKGPTRKIEKQESNGLHLDVPNFQLTQEQLETIIRGQSKEIIERIVWKLIPEIADKLIKEEIHRLMDETKL